MNDMRQILEDFLNNSSPEQLREELTKGNRPFFQTIEDAMLVCECESSFPVSIQAGVSFFKGIFSQASAPSKEWHGLSDAKRDLAANQELALAA
jgi:hypothetical protein